MNAAEELREAARLMREAWTVPAENLRRMRESTSGSHKNLSTMPGTMLAVADLLENEASLIESTWEHPDLHMPLNGARVSLLLSLAHSYLGMAA